MMNIGFILMSQFQELNIGSSIKYMGFDVGVVKRDKNKSKKLWRDKK